MALKCELIASSTGEHLTQLFAGFGALQRSGEISLTARRAENFVLHAEGSFAKVVIDNRVRVGFDMFDGAKIKPEHDIESCDVYFKRSFDPATAALHPRGACIRPFGLNYSVYGPGDQHIRRIGWCLAALRPKTIGPVLKQVARLSRGLSYALAENGRSTCWHSNFEQEPTDSGNGSVLLLTRTWTGRLEHEEMNALRASCIRTLREEFGPRFIGGFAPTPHACQAYPDCVVDPAVCRKRRYLEVMKRAAVCVATRGLQGSNGWRLAEYLAASRAIVSEPLRFEVPNLVPGVHYLTMTSAEECVAQVKALSDDAARRHEMMRANAAFYRANLRPDSIVRRCLNIAISGSESQPLAMAG